MRVLVITYPAWNTSNNTGNTLSNIFNGFNGEFANIFFSEELPKNDFCKNYFQITDVGVLKHLFKGEPLGKKFDIINKASESSFEEQAKKHKSIFTLLLRQLVWSLVRIDNKEMYDFISRFNPDIIFSPTYANPYVLRTVHNIKKTTNLPIVSIISDDLYSYKNYMKTPLKRYYQSMIRKSIDKVFKDYDLLYTMSEKQKEEYEPIYGKEMKLLYKTSNKQYVKHIPNKVKKLIYAGGLYLGRDIILKEIVNIIRCANEKEKQFELHIFSNSKNYDDIVKDDENCFVHESIAYEELQKEYERNDIALHVESFDERYLEDTRLSFSTKIVDCLESGLPVLAIGPKENAGLAYLKKEDAAICVFDKDAISDGLKEVCDYYEEYQDKAYACLLKNHNSKKKTEMIKADFQQLVDKYKGVTE